MREMGTIVLLLFYSSGSTSPLSLPLDCNNKDWYLEQSNENINCSCDKQATAFQAVSSFYTQWKSQVSCRLGTDLPSWHKVAESFVRFVLEPSPSDILLPFETWY